ncbi:MAG: hypothetical protein SF051_10185 [Elusimicrobiota bacterium]|nr:hypothetical protein [Elusimicrobiota bacterium]
MAVAALAYDPIEDAQLYWSDGRLAAVYGTRVEFYRYGRLTPAVVRPDHAARPLLPGVSARGLPAFLDARGRVVEVRPVVKAFADGLHPPPEKAAGSKTVSICSRDPGAFCGVLGLDGEEKIVLRGEEEPGVERRPVGSKPDGSEALFELSRPRPSGDREVVGYRLWRKRGKSPAREEVLSPDDPQVGVLLESYEGPLLLLPPGGELHFQEREPSRRRR